MHFFFGLLIFGIWHWICQLQLLWPTLPFRYNWLWIGYCLWTILCYTVHHPIHLWWNDALTLPANVVSPLMLDRAFGEVSQHILSCPCPFPNNIEIKAHDSVSLDLVKGKWTPAKFGLIWKPFECTLHKPNLKVVHYSFDEEQWY